VLLLLAWQLKRHGLSRLAGLLVLALGVQISLGISTWCFICHYWWPWRITWAVLALLLTLVLIIGCAARYGWHPAADAHADLRVAEQITKQSRRDRSYSGARTPRPR
jgi:cytochrome c oxidase assembly protein subunit 15